MDSKLYNVGSYLRLSRENTGYVGHESMSLENQEAMLSKFIAMMPGWVEKRTYIDNGASGGNFNRQGFKDMMDDVRNGIINLVLVQDLSRFGRNYLETGKYLEEELPALGCRFVALADGVDTEDGENDIMPFLNAMNDFYLKNLSDRIKSVFAAKAKAGHKLSGAAPYGYRRNPDDHTKLVVDSYAAEIVRQIFRMRADGLGYGKIVSALNKNNVPPPRLHFYLSQNREPSARCSETWQIHVIPKILRDEHYLGNTVSFRYTRNYRSSKARKRNEDEWLRVPDTHEAIIDTVLWEKAQKVNERLAKWVENAGEPQTYLFSGKVFCADCKVVMMPHSEKRYTGKKTKDSDERRYSYCCKTYHVSGREKCSRHSINEEALKKTVLGSIKAHAAVITLDEERMTSELRSKLLGDFAADRAETQRELGKLKQTLHNIDLKLEQLYMDKISGGISAETFTVLAGKAEAERNDIAGTIAVMEQSSAKEKERLGDIQSWIRLVKENAAVTDLDRAMLDALVERVEVGESMVENGVKVQDVRIIYKFVGAV
jgi:DNA invertase Pin-like site-specific DNA recombinase